MSAKPSCVLCAKPIRKEADGKKVPEDFFGNRVLPPRAKQVAAESGAPDTELLHKTLCYPAVTREIGEIRKEQEGRMTRRGEYHPAELKARGGRATEGEKLTIDDLSFLILCTLPLVRVTRRTEMHARIGRLLLE